MTDHDFFKTAIDLDIPVCIYLINGMCLTGTIVQQPNSDGYMDYIILKPMTPYDDDIFPYQYIVMNNITTIQKLKEKNHNKGK